MRILIVLVPGFSHLSLGAILEPLHRLKAVKPKTRLRIEVGSVTERQVPSKIGLDVTCELSFSNSLQALKGPDRAQTLFLCCGLRSPYKSQGNIQKLLRLAHHAGTEILGTGCSAWKMADAGLLQNGAGTVHWTTLPAFAERHHNISARDALFVTSNHVTSTPGEAATLDMVIAFIQRQVGDELTQQLCAHLMISFPRMGNTDQPREQTGFLRSAPPKLRQALGLMSNHLENPLLLRDITTRIGLSIRQTERLFAAHLGQSPKAYYRKLRMQHGRLLIEHTSMSILEISLATGFSNRRIFSKYYRDEFGFPPSFTRRVP